MKYQIGDVILLKPVTITVVDKDSVSLPYAYCNDDGDDEWFSEAEIACLLSRPKPEPVVKLKVGDVAWHRTNQELCVVIGMSGSDWFPYQIKVIWDTGEHIPGEVYNSSDNYLTKIELPE